MTLLEGRVGSKELQSQIRGAAEALGEQMSQVIPFKPSRIAKFMGAVQVSQRAVIPRKGQEGVFTRVRLERKSALNTADSPIRLLTDVVTVDPSRKSQSAQFARAVKVAATYDFYDGLELSQELGVSQERTLERIHELGSYVAAIAETELHEELRCAPVRLKP